MAFRVGQKVVLVSVGRIPGEHQVGPLAPVTVGTVYTVRQIEPIYLRHFGMVGIRIDEHVSPLVRYGDIYFEPAFLSVRFRPVVSTESGMAILEQIRRDVTNKELRPIMAGD